MLPLFGGNKRNFLDVTIIMHNPKKMKKLVLSVIMIALLSFISTAQTITITESGGWIESAYVKWQDTTDSLTYNIYYSGEGIIDRKIDNQLIRHYGNYYRADVMGLKAGSYTLKIAPVVDGVEGSAVSTSQINVTAHDRSGFAFHDGRTPGAYKVDGTPKDNAVILYITEKSKNNISMEVTGANDNPCVGLQTILDGFKKGSDLRPLIVRFVGQITDLEYMLNGDIVVENKRNAASYITLEGVGDDAVADGWGIRIKNATNIEIRNLATMNCNSDEGDNIGLQQDNDHIWVHHCDFFYGDAGGNADQAKGDGALDSKRSGYVTFSYNHFWDTGKSNLLGNGTENPEYLTYHHNWYDHSDSRHPRVRSHSVHVYNNYYDGIAKYGIGSTLASSVFVEANYFRNCRYPILTSMQGSDVWDESKQANDYVNMPTFSKEDGGSIKAFNNYMTGQRRFVAYGAEGYPNSTIDFDAWVASSRDEQMSADIKSSRGLNTYNNFDTNPSIMYNYTVDSPEEARDKVMQYAGRMMGGDFKWTFNNAVDDTNYDVNPALKAALKAYKTSLVSVQGDSITDDEDPNDPNDPVDPSGDQIHNFTLDGKTSNFFTINGNLSDSKGTVNYGELTLTQCLKIESVTMITFNTTEEAVLTLVFNPEFSGRIKINGTDYSATAGVVTITLQAGSHQISKTDTANLFYISLLFTTTGIGEATSTQLKLYPNPVHSSLFIESTDQVERIEVFTLTGQSVLHATGNVQLIDLSRLQSGTYMVRVISNSGTTTHKIQKH